jgi:3-deoxy-D-manno-octulosonate 8-phosphate phosphatase KdsC-like HAD superfamily phosphatase
MEDKQDTSQTKAEIDDNIEDLLLSAYYRGKDGNGYSTFELRDDIAAILALVQAAEVRARIEELERLYLVYGSKDKPASMDNMFSLSKKGEVCATPIKNRLAELTKQAEEKL